MVCLHVALAFYRGRAIIIAEIITHFDSDGLQPGPPQPGRRPGRACACTCAGRVQRWPDSSQTCVAGSCEVDAIGAAEVAAAACPTAQSAGSCACVRACRAHRCTESGGGELRRCLPGWWGWWGWQTYCGVTSISRHRVVRSSGTSCRGRFERTSVEGVRSERPMAAETARARRAGRGNGRTGIAA
jgi:hypothetical protein